jgi:hypothetical protein
MRSKFSSDWLSSYIKAKQPVLQMIKMALYFPDSPRIHLVVGKLSFDLGEKIPLAPNQPKRNYRVK